MNYLYSLKNSGYKITIYLSFQCTLILNTFSLPPQSHQWELRHHSQREHHWCPTRLPWFFYYCSMKPSCCMLFCLRLYFNVSIFMQLLGVVVLVLLFFAQTGALEKRRIIKKIYINLYLKVRKWPAVRK